MQARNVKGQKSVLRVTKIIPEIYRQMSVGSCILLGMTTKWKKYTYLNTNTDTLVEVTQLETSRENINPILASNPYVLLSVEDATIQPNLTKEENMTSDAPIFTTEYLESTLIEKQHRINELEGKLISLGQHSNVNLIERQRMQNEMQEWTMEEVHSCGINEEQAFQIASICGFELEQEFEVEITVTYSATVKARNEEDAESAVHDIDFDTVDYNTDYITYMSSSVDSVNV